MPVRKVDGGYQWGSKGKIYPTRKEANKQQAAAYASGYKDTKAKSKGSNMKPVPPSAQGMAPQPTNRNGLTRRQKAKRKIGRVAQNRMGYAKGGMVKTGKLDTGIRSCSHGS